MKILRLSLPRATAWVLRGLACSLVLAPVAVQAQLSITFPVARTVFQRTNDNQAQLAVAGLCPGATDRVEGRLTALVPGQGQSTDWVDLNAGPMQGQFAGRLPATGGWYRLELRAWQAATVLATTSLQPVGVGEVFAIAGQSNGQGINDRNAVEPADGRVVCAPHFNLNDTIALPLPALAGPVSMTGVIGPRGLTSWCWGRLGDRLAARLNVPVAFYNAAWSGTAIRNWRESITVDSTATSYNEYFRPGMPYGNLKRIVQDYARLTGLRAVLWHQGEAEFYDTDPTAANYFADLQTVILQSRRDAGFDLTWVVARASMDNNLLLNYGLTHYEPVVSAQNRIVQQVPLVYYGPDTDVIQMPRTDGVHFSDEGLRQVGDAWNDYLTDDFFRTVAPFLPPSVQLSDLSLRMQVDRKAPAPEQPVRLTIVVRNDGARPVTNVRLRCELPKPLVFMTGSGLTHQRGLVLATVPAVQPNGAVSLTFTARPTQPGNYQVAAEIVRAAQLDPDSRPNTSIGDGQDDCAQVTFRVGRIDSVRYQTAVSVNADPLPAQLTNQPPADPDRTDLSLRLALSQPVERVGQVVSVSLTVSNRGGRSSGSVQISCALPANLTFLDSPTMSLAGTTVRGTIGDIPTNNSATLTFRATATQTGNAVARAQIESAAVADPDSTPNNGFTNGEDDAGQLRIRIK